MADILWRDTALTPKIFILDARALSWSRASRSWYSRRSRPIISMDAPASALLEGSTSP